MPRIDPSLDYISQKMRGGNPPTPPGEPVPQGKALKDHIAAWMSGAPMSDQPTMGDQTDTTANDGSAQSAEDEARSRIEQIDPEILTAADDPTDESHDLALRIVRAYSKIVEIERQKAGQ
jgi:hypothetical protein